MSREEFEQKGATQYTLDRIEEISARMGAGKPYSRWRRFQVWLHRLLFPGCDGSVW